MKSSSNKDSSPNVCDSYVIPVYRAAALTIAAYRIVIPFLATRRFFDRSTDGAVASTGLLIGWVAAIAMFVIGCLVLLLTSSPSPQEERQLKQW